MQDLAGPALMRKVERDHVDPGQSLGELANALVVRPVAPPDDERAVVKPERVPALYESWSLDPRCDGNTRLDEIGRHDLDLAASAFLSRAQ
jgi:hypothetical protein